MRRRARGFTLMEILIAMALTTIVTASVLAIVRTQLSAFEMNDQVVRTQQSARAAMDFLESTVRRACGGVAAGPIGVNTTMVHKQVDCLQFIDSASVAATTFSTSSNTNPDALEVVYASNTMTALATVPTLSSSPTIAVNDITGFFTGDLVLVSDYNTAYLMQVASVATSAAQRPKAGTITFTTNATTDPKTGPPSLVVGSPVFKATTYSFFVAPANASPAAYANMLMVDPNGVTSSNHLDYGVSVQPAVEGVVDFQVAIGQDKEPDGFITEIPSSKSTDEWIGNYDGETAAPPSPWNTATAYPQLRQVRLTLMLNTLNQYAGSTGTISAFENRAAASYPPSATVGPRYRTASMVVAPRAWNLSE